MKTFKLICTFFVLGLSFTACSKSHQKQSEDDTKTNFTVEISSSDEVVNYYNKPYEYEYHINNKYNVVPSPDNEPPAGKLLLDSYGRIKAIDLGYWHKVDKYLSKSFSRVDITTFFSY